MSEPSQDYFRHKIDYETLAGFVETLEPGREYSTRELWQAYNGRKGFRGDFAIFRYAIKKAGMEQLDHPKRLRRNT